jgi:hypothetical protein
MAKASLLRRESTYNSGPITESIYTSDSQESEIVSVIREQDELHSGGIGSLHRCSHINDSRIAE